MEQLLSLGKQQIEGPQNISMAAAANPECPVPLCGDAGGCPTASSHDLVVICLQCGGAD